MFSDEHIIERVLKGNTQDYYELMQRYQRQMFRLAYRILGRREEAEDAVQETFIKAFSNLKSCRDRSKFWPWVRRIGTNTCLAKLSREEPSDELDKLADADWQCEHSVETKALREVEAEDIRKAVAGLPSTYRIVVILRFEEELSHKEIAELLNEQVPAIQVRLHRAKKMLAERLGVMEHEMR